MKNDNLVIRPKRPKGEDGYRVFSIRVREELVAQMDEVAGRTGYSRNQLAGMFLAYALEHYEIVEETQGEEAKKGG